MERNDPMPWDTHRPHGVGCAPLNQPCDKNEAFLCAGLPNPEPSKREHESTLIPTNPKLAKISVN